MSEPAAVEQAAVKPEEVRWVLYALGELKWVPLGVPHPDGSATEARPQHGLISSPTERQGIYAAEFTMILARLADAFHGLAPMERRLVALLVQGRSRRATRSILRIGGGKLDRYFDVICKEIAADLADLDPACWSHFCRQLRRLV